MSTLKQFALATAVLASTSTPSYAFLTELVVGLTSVTNNLIDSTESVTNNTVNTASTTMLSLSSNPGKMADRIGLMADRIGFMADRIVTTEGIMAGLAHKIIDSTTQPRVMHQYASAYAPAPQPMQARYPSSQPNTRIESGYGNPYSAHSASYAPVTPAAPAYALPDNSRYSASYMIYGNTGSTYNSVRPATPTPASAANAYAASGYGFSAQPFVNKTAANSCPTAYGVKRSC